MKNLLLFAFVALSFSANAQFTVWEDDFNDGDITDWTIWDINADGHKWQTSRNVQATETGGYDNTTLGEHKVMSVYAFDFETFEFFPNPDHEWVASPAIDLSFYGGTTELVVNTQMMIQDGDSKLYIYGSTSPERESFILLKTLTVERMPQGEPVTLFKDFVIDISAYAGEDEFYFALVTDEFALFTGHEVDNVKITATEVVAGIDGVTKTATKIRQNPVAETLQLQLGSTVSTEALSLQIYNVSGMLVKTAEYNEAGVSVSDLAGGMYFLQLSDGNVTERLKFIKK